MDGFLLVNKQSGMTSFDVIRQVKKQLGQIKIGHTGTLDPQTTGILVLALGKGCKFINEITNDSKKKYVATMQFGIKTDTGDISGTILEKRKFSLDEEEIRQKFSKFQKTYEQIPPIYSAKKINGKRAYKLARKNEYVDMTKSKKEVTIYKLKILSLNKEEGKICFDCTVSKGTYIRSLIEDIALELNEIATMTDLKRTYTDGFSIEDSISLEEDFKSNIIPLDYYIKTKYKSSLSIENKILKLVENGVQIKNENIIKKFDEQILDNRLVLKNEEGKIIAIYEKKI